MAYNIRRRLLLPALLSVWFSIIQDPHPAHGFTATGIRNVDLLVGLETGIDLDTRGFTGIQNADLTDIQEKRISNVLAHQDALLTLVVEGNTTFLDEGRTIEIEDMISIHFMEGVYGGKSITRVQALLEEEGDRVPISGNGIRLNGALMYFQNDDNVATLEPTEELLQECPTNAPYPTRENIMPTTCVIRREISGREYNTDTADQSQTAFELTPYTNEPGGTVLAEDSSQRERDQGFISSMLGPNLPGREVSFAIAEHYTLDGKNRKAWWINPAYNWFPADLTGNYIFIVSQRILLFALVNHYPVGGGQRRLLSTAESGNIAAADVSFTGIDSHSLIATVFGVSPGRVASFNAEVWLTEDQACLSNARLRTEILTQFKDVISEVSSVLGTGGVQLTHMDVNRAVACAGYRRRRRTLLQVFSPAKAEVEIVVIFGGGIGQMAEIDVDAIAAQPFVISFAPLRVSKTDVDLNPQPIQTPKPGGGGGGIDILVVLGSVGAGVGLVVAGVLAYWYHSSTKNKPRVDDNSADLVNTNFSHNNNNNNTLLIPETRGVPSAPAFENVQGEGVKSDLVMQLEWQLAEDRPEVVAEFEPERAAAEAAAAAEDAEEAGGNDPDSHRRSSQTLGRSQSKRSSANPNEIVPKRDMARVDSKATRTSGVSRVDSKGRKEKEETPVSRVNSRISQRRTSGRDEGRRTPDARNERPLGRSDSRKNTRRSAELREERRGRDYDRDGVEIDDEIDEESMTDEEGSDVVMELEQRPPRQERRRPSVTSSIAPSVYSTSSQQASANKVHKWLKRSQEFNDSFVEM